VPPALALFASRGIGNPACAPLHFASRITAPGAPVIAFLFDTNYAPPKKLACSIRSRGHFLFDTFGRFFLRPAVAANAPCRHPEPTTAGEGSLPVFLQLLPLRSAIAAFAATLKRPNVPTRTRRMLLINVPAIRDVRNSQKTNNGDQF